MNLNQLLTFYHAAQEMNFSRAAASLNVTQPAISTQIRLLEQELGVRLFARLGKRLVLTEPGEVLLGYAKKIFSLHHEAGEVMDQLRLVRRGTLKLGSARTYARHILPPLLANYQNHYPQVNIVLMEGSSQDMTRSLRSLEIEVALVAYAGPEKQVKFDFFKSEELVVIVHPSHELAFKDKVTVERLVGEPFLMREKGSGTRRVVDDMFKRHGVKPRTVFETSNAEVIKEQVARGVGVSILTRSAAYRDVLARQLAVTKLADEALQLEIYVAVREGHELSRPANVFLDLLYNTKKADSPNHAN